MSGIDTTGSSTAPFGLVDHFQVGDHARVEATLKDLAALGIQHLRTRVSFAEYASPRGHAWFEWLFERVTMEVTLLPSFTLGPRPGCPVAEPPPDPEEFAAFVAHFTDKFAQRVHWIELGDNPRDLRQYDWRADPNFERYAALMTAAAERAEKAGVKLALASSTPFDPVLLRTLLQHGLARHISAVSLRGFPEVFDPGWAGWEQALEATRAAVHAQVPRAELWIGGAGFSTWRGDERRQLAEFVDAQRANADRIYWYGVRDVPLPEHDTPGALFDVREHHYGLRDQDGAPKLLMRLWLQHGAQKLRELRQLTAPSRPRRNPGERHTVVFGGAGFIGSNVANALLSEGRKVLVFDSLARGSVETNLRWLKERHGDRLGVRVADVRDARAVREAMEGAEEVFHFSAQVAVTTSLVDPVHDFEVNARGTLNMLEAARDQDPPPRILFTSTNKVYGGLEDIALTLKSARYEPESPEVRYFGVSEARSVDCESPYGCSKGAADQYVLDYARSFGLDTVVFRMSCIYGPRQFGNEDQGWVAHFLLQALKGQPITLYGDGKQVRDILFVEDLVNAMRLAMNNIKKVRGTAFNIGGGPKQTVSLLELLAKIEAMLGRAPEVRFDDWRTGDQRYYVSDVRRFEVATGWRPKVDVDQGLTRLLGWLQSVVGSRPARAPLESEARETHGV